MHLREPTKKLLASNLVELSERTELLAREEASGRMELASHVRQIEVKLDAIIGALGAGGAPAGGGWLKSLIGDGQAGANALSA